MPLKSNGMIHGSFLTWSETAKKILRGSQLTCAGLNVLKFKMEELD